MHLVEQGFEFLVGDLVIAAGCCRRLVLVAGIGPRLYGLGLAARSMQIVKQGLEFLVGNLVAVATRSRHSLFGLLLDRAFHGLGLAAGSVQGIEQSLELVIADLVAAGHELLHRVGGVDRRGGLGSGCIDGIGDFLVAGSFRFGGRLGFGFGRRGIGVLHVDQLLDQRRISRGRVLAAADLLKHGIEFVEHAQEGVHHVGIQLQLVVAQQVEYVFGLVADLDQVGQRKEAAAALDGVEPTEDGIEQIGVVGGLFEVHQLLVEGLEDFPGFNQEILENFVVQIYGHGFTRVACQKPRLASRSSTSP